MTRTVFVGALTALLAGSALAVAWAGPRKPAKPPRHVFAFLSHAGGEELQRLAQVGRRISVLAPNWFSLDLAAGTIVGPSNPAPVIAAAAKVGVPLWPVVNANTGGAPEIAEAAARERAAQAVAKVAETAPYRGVTLDIEGLAPSQRGDYSAFVSRVAQLVHADERKVAVYAPRPSGVGSALAYDLPALRRAADLVLVSTYNEHAPGTDPGPVDTHDGFSKVLKQTRAISRSRIAPILGAIGYAWPTGGGQGRLLSTVQATKGRSSCNTGGATASVAASVASALTGSGAYACNGEIVYYATLEGLRQRARAVGAAGFSWIALFSLGREPRGFWDGMPLLRGPGRTR